MELDDDSDLSSSSSSYSSVGEESVGEEEDDDSEDEAPPGPKGAERGDQGRRKRKRKLAGRRREIRTKYESVKDFNPEARSAQTEEIERIRRLELQRTLQAANPSAARVAGATDDAAEGSALLGRSPVFRNLAEDEKRERVEAIVISSDSEDEEDVQRAVGGGVVVNRTKMTEGGREEGGEEERRGGRYDVVGEGEGEQVIVNLGHLPEEEDVELPPQIARIIKPHQVGGVRFLYDNLIESLSRFRTSTGFGCILAHSMGLGKTLQVISFIDIFFRYTPGRHVLCVVPVNTLQNWVVEFDKWLPDKEKEERKKNGGGSAGKPSKSRNKRSQQNGRLSKTTPPDLPQPPSTATLHPQLSGGLPSIVTNDAVSMPTIAMDTRGSSQLFPNVLSEADQQLLMSLTSNITPHLPPSLSPREKLVSNTPGGLPQGNTANFSSASAPGSRSHTPIPGVSDSRSHTASPSTPDVQYRTFKLFVLSDSVRNMETRLRLIKQWKAEGGVLLIGYEMYRLLSLSVPSLGGNKMAVKKRKTKTQQANSQNNSFVDLDENEREMEKLIEIQQALCVPGPDLVVCDEGHRIKNDYTNISQALKKIHTRRRVVLTGYPLQNNLLEYWCMVDFVRPKYLGTKQEFCDLFERPISNGQCMDSTPKDVRTMRYRSHVLHTLLKGFVLRRGHEILKCTLPAKFEHVLLVRPSPVQAALYDYNMNSLQQGGTSTTAGPLKAFAVCTKIWNHPDIYYNEAKVGETKKSSPLSWLDEAGLPKSLLPTCKSETGTTAKPTAALSMLPPYETGRLDNSPKMVVTMEILDRSVQFGDKLLIFSQSLLALSYIESLLVRRPIPIPHSAGPAGEVQYSGTMWSKNVNFCRLDGSTGSADRDRLITAFNSPNNKDMWVFLLSTRAGCLGINLTGANRVIVLDVSWNPCYDAQAVCRVYRYGQTKPCHIYRLVCDGTMERKIYDRQISKQGMADRVVDELQPERHFTADEIITLMRPLTPLPPPQDLSSSAFHFRFDQVLFILCQHFGPLLTKFPFRHESLLLDSANEKMTEVEKVYAMRGFQQDWNARKRNTAPHLSVQRHNPPVSPQPPRQSGVPSPMATSNVAPPTSSLCVSPYPNMRVGTPSSATPSPNHLAYSMPSHSSTNIPSQQYSHNSIPGCTSSSSNIATSSNTAITSGIPNRGDFICVDSDTELDWNRIRANSNGNAVGGATSLIDHMTSQATLLPGPKVLTVPMSPALGPTHSSSGSTPFPADHTSSAVSGVGSPTFNTAVAHLMAFMRQREGMGRSHVDSSVSSSSLSSLGPQTQTNLTPSSNSLSYNSQSTFAHDPATAVPSVGQHSVSAGQMLPCNDQQLPLSSQQISAADRNQSILTGLNLPTLTTHSSSAIPGQYLGHPALNSGQQTSILGQSTPPLQPTSVPIAHTSVNGHFNPGFPTLPANSSTALTGLSQYNAHLSSLLQTTHEPVSSLQNTQHQCSIPSSVYSQSVPLAGNPTLPPSPLPSSSTSPSGMTSFPAHDLATSPPRPLFSPPKLPLSREAPLGGTLHSSTAPILPQSTRVSSSTAPPTTSQNNISSPSPPLPSPHPPPSSLPRSPSTAITTSPLSQPPTPSTSIPLLSPVAAHFFQVSMSKSPKPSPSPGHTPTPSPSPHPHPLTSPPLRSPPSVSTAASPAMISSSSAQSSAHSGFHSNTTLNRDNPPDPHSNVSDNYGNSCVITH